MRNLKKLFAVVMVVAMLASIMVPALAADGVQYEAEAEMLKDLGLFKGTNKGFELEGELTREQALALMIRVMGLEAEVEAMSEAEVAEQMAKVVDPETVTDWAKPYVAYAIKHQLTDGIDAKIKPNVKFAGQLTITGKEFINFMLKGMGYDMTGKWDEVLAFAAEAGMLSASQAVNFGNIAVLKRDHAVAIMASALNGTTADGITLAEALVKAGAVDEDKMIEYGFITPAVTPTEAPKAFEATASTDNLVQLYVEFNREVDKESAEDKGNYDIKDIDIADAALQDDGVTVVLTLDFEDVEKEIEQQYTTDLKISGVKDLDGNVMKDYTIEDIEFIDTTIPTAVDAAVVGSDTIKVTFSEPVRVYKYDVANKTYELNKSYFSVNNGKSYVKRVKLQNNNTEALVELYNDLKEGEVTLTVKSGTEDFAGFGVIVKTFNLEVVPDEEAPVVIGYEKASRTEVTLIWNEDIEVNGKFNYKDFYHTNSKNTVKDPNDLGEGEYSVKFDGNKTTLYFDDDSLLPNGTAYVYVMKEAVRDLWDNANEQQMIKVEVEVDVTPPEVDKVDVKAEDKIEVKFTEELDKDTAEDIDNYTILDKDGKEVKEVIDDITYTSKKVTIVFEDKLSGDYTIVIENVKDKAGNKISKTSVDFTVGDITAPDISKFKATLYRAGEEDQMLRIAFDDKMSTDGKYSVTDVEKYAILKANQVDVIARLEDIDGVEIEVVDDGKAVEIYVPSSKDVNKKDGDNKKSGEHYLDLVAGTYVQIGRVADEAGNKIDVMTVNVKIEASTSIDIDKVEATARDTIEITFKDELADFDEDDIEIYVNGVKYGDDKIAGVDTKVNKDGNTVAVFTLDDDYLLKNDLSKTPVKVKVVGEESENRYGKKLTKMEKDAVDKIKPELFDDGKKDESYAAKKFGYDYEGIDAEKKKYYANRYVGDYFALHEENELYYSVVDSVYYFKASLYVNEEVKSIKPNAYSAIGSDFVVKLDGKKLTNITDYKVDIGVNDEDNGAYELIFYFKAKEVKEKIEGVDTVVGYELKGDLEIQLSSEASYIVDNSGKDNKLATFDKIELDNIIFNTVED